MSISQKIDGKNNTQIAVEGNLNGDISLGNSHTVNGPYTILCPNCENPVSKATTACPHCGHNVLKHLKLKENKDKKSSLKEATIFLLICFFVTLVLTQILPGSVKTYFTWACIVFLAMAIGAFYARYDLEQKEQK